MSIYLYPTTFVHLIYIVWASIFELFPFIIYKEIYRKSLFVTRIETSFSPRNALLWITTAIALLAASSVVSLEQVTPDRAYNFLMMTPVSSSSHRHIFMPLATALTERGHNVSHFAKYIRHTKSMLWLIRICHFRIFLNWISKSMHSKFPKLITI